MTITTKTEITPGLNKQREVNSPAAGFQHRSFHLQRRHAKVGDTYVVLLVQQQVFRFQVSMTEKQIGNKQADRENTENRTESNYETTGTQLRNKISNFTAKVCSISNI